jgi:hypothetical protein
MRTGYLSFPIVTLMSAAVLVCLPLLAKAKDDFPPDGDFKKYGHLSTEAFNNAGANKDCAAYQEAMSYWLKAYNEAVTHLHATKNYVQRELSTVKNPGNPKVIQGTREMYEGLLDEEISIVNWVQYKYDIQYDATEKGCTLKFVGEGTLK